MKVRTELLLKPSEFKIAHSDSIVTIGSCFSQVIGDKLVKSKFNTLVNPFGTLFNPVSIADVLRASLDKNAALLHNSIESQGVWYNYSFHSSIFGNSKAELEDKVNRKIEEVHSRLISATTILITLGTAYVYKLNLGGRIVANCHKIPASEFTKDLLSVNEIIASLQSFIEAFKIHNSKFKIILTVSPVRHIKDSITLNSVSKAILRLACHELAQKNREVDYFPSYELMVDDLRDYRYYKEDMIHPSEVAEKYIWDKFSETYFNATTQSILKEWTNIQNALNHRPFRVDSEEYRVFIKDTLEKAEKLKDVINIDEEIRLLKG